MTDADRMLLLEGALAHAERENESLRHGLKLILDLTGILSPVTSEVNVSAYRAGQTAAVKAVEDAGGDNTDYHVAAIRAILADKE